ncbi:MAG TPA: FtsQ-type POTRA domain-containing protein [Candidatus Limnocylindria bacterium]|nr:FtsQ-type POTRA domain-containing protein [Candidatus Limnocylindria bacterium]
MACAAALVVVALADLARVDDVVVAGGRHVSRDSARSQSGLDGVPTFLASSADARAQLRTLPAVRDARVEIVLPSTARITLVEREAVGRWVAGDTVEWFVDASGVLFPSLDRTGAPDLRVYDERGPRSAGERIDPPVLVEVALRLAAIAPGELRGDAADLRVVMTAGASGLVLRTGAGWEIRFGSPDRFDEKLSLAKRFLRDNPTRRLDYVDVRSPDRIVFSPN